jgi:hypothetical protein
MAAKAVLNLRKMPCVLAESVNCRTEIHGDDSVPACDFALKNLLLSRDDIDALLGEGSWERFYVKRMNSGMADYPELSEFVNRSKTPFAFAHKFEASRVALFLGLEDKELVFEGCKLAKIRYEPLQGGQFSVSLQVQATPVDGEIATLFAHMNSDAHAKVRFGKLEEKKSDQSKTSCRSSPAWTNTP